MAPFYERRVDRRGRVDPESEKRLNPGDKVTLGRISGGKGEGHRYSVSVEIETNDKARVEVFDRDTPAEVVGLTIEEDRETVPTLEKHLDGPIRVYPVYREEGVSVQERIGVDLDPKPKKVVIWKEDPEWRKDHPLSTSSFGLLNKINKRIDDDWERSRLLSLGEFIISLPVQIPLILVGSIAFPLELITVRPARWLAKRARERKK